MPRCCSKGRAAPARSCSRAALHALSDRADGPFVAINCAAIPETLLETELFGHEKGAFTGAITRKLGRFEVAHRGTLLLDEIGDLSLPLQAKILRALEEKQFERVGGTQTLRVDVRVVAATHRNLRQRVADRQFREDLFFRLSVFPIRIPALRERGGDIVILARHFVEKFARELSKPGTQAVGQRASRRCARTPGRETCASCRTASSARPSCARTTRFTPAQSQSVRTAADRARRAVQPVGSRSIFQGTLPEALGARRPRSNGARSTQAMKDAAARRRRPPRLLDLNYKVLLHKLREYRSRSSSDRSSPSGPGTCCVIVRRVVRDDAPIASRCTSRYSVTDACSRTSCIGTPLAVLAWRTVQHFDRVTQRSPRSTRRSSMRCVCWVQQRRRVLRQAAKQRS